MKTTTISTSDPIYEDAVTLRYDLFFRNFGFSKDVTRDEYEEDSIHFATTDEDRLIAYARLTHLGYQKYKISQIVVDPQFQRQGHGRAILVHAIGAAKNMGAKSFQLNAQLSARALYESLGFEGVGKVYGSKFTSIPHIKMTLKVDR